jgi:hypothetical protein
MFLDVLTLTDQSPITIVCSPPEIASLTPGRGVMPAHGWIFSCLSSIPMNCSIRRARVSAFFAV